MFPTISGDRYSLDTRSFAKNTGDTVKRAGIGRPVTKFHDLRRTFGSLCLEARVPLVVVAEWLGHRSVETTRKVYARISGLFSSEEMQRVGDYWTRKRAEQAAKLPSMPSGLSGPRVPVLGATSGATSAGFGATKDRVVN